MKGVIKVATLSVLAIVLIIIAHPISLSNEYMGSVAGAIVFIIVGMIISELLALFSLKFSDLLAKLFRKK